MAATASPLPLDESNNAWGFAHELGHNFNFVGGDWYYTTWAGLESWPNVFTVHALEQLGLPERELNGDSRKADYFASGNQGKDLGGAWGGLCFLLEFKQQYGWQVFDSFYQEFNLSPGYDWQFLRQRMNSAAGEDSSAIFDSWNIPR